MAFSAKSVYLVRQNGRHGKGTSSGTAIHKNFLEYEAMLKKNSFIILLMTLTICAAVIAQDTNPNTNAWDDTDITHVIDAKTGVITFKNKKTGESVVYQQGQMPERFQKLLNERGFQSQTQPFADGLVLEAKPKTNPANSGSNSRKARPGSVRNLEQTNGGLDTADEQPEFGDPALRKQPGTKAKTAVRRKNSGTTSRHKKPRRVNMEDGVFLPGYKQKNRKQPTQSLLPYMEQNNRRKPGARGYTLDGKGTDVNVEERSKNPAGGKPKPAGYNLPEVGDEVLLKSKNPAGTVRKSHDRYANQETSYRTSAPKKSKAKRAATTQRKAKYQHNQSDPEFRRKRN